MGNCKCSQSDVLLKPYEYCRECFYKKLDELNPGGAGMSEKATKAMPYKLITHLDRVKYMSYGVHQWLYNKAMDGCKESLFKLEYGYNLHSEVLAKFKEEQQ